MRHLLKGKTMNALPTAGALALALCVLSTNSLAQERCIDRDIAVKSMAENYGEVLRGTGILAQGQALLEFYMNEETGSFTIVISSWSEAAQKIISCFKVGGADWIPLDPPVQGDPA